MVEQSVAWARVWAPWMPDDEAQVVAEGVAADPRKWTAAALAWRLGLSMGGRTALNITNTGAHE